MVICASRAHSACHSVRRAVHQRLGLDVVLRRSALDEVAGQRERRAGEADQRRRAELGHEQAHRLGDERDVGRRQLGHPVKIGQRAYGLGDDRPDARLDLDVDAGRVQRHHDVAEQDRRVHRRAGAPAAA